jgi:Mg-chelatase subunit ChlD
MSGRGRQGRAAPPGACIARRFPGAARILALLMAFGAPALAHGAELRVEIRRPAARQLLSGLEPSTEVEGGASIYGGVEALDLFLVLDSSRSLLRTDPDDYRTAGAIGLVDSFPTGGSIRIGVIDFDRGAVVLAPLTEDRAAVKQALHVLDRDGSTDLAGGVRAALDAFAAEGRPGSSRGVLLFTDGKTNPRKARRVTEEARQQGVALHALLLGGDDGGAQILRDLAGGTGGSFVRVSDPRELPEAFRRLRTTGVERVTLRVNDAAPIPAHLAGGTFTGRVALRPGANRIVATATSLSGEEREDAVTVFVAGPLGVTIETPADGAQLLEEGVAEVEGSAALAFPAPASPDVTQQASPAIEPGWGMRDVTISVNGSAPVPATLQRGRFRGRVALRTGENSIVATATSADGRTARDEIRVRVRPPGCAELRVEGRRGGEPAASISDRAVEIVFDASNSMWGRIDGRPKIEIGKATLTDALGWLPSDLSLALRVYGHRYPRERRECTDSELLVAPGSGGRERIRAAIASFRPRGQTPLAYSLERVAQDLGGLDGERASVLVTDGIESCGGDPVGAARVLKGKGITVHVIGFGLGHGDAADVASLRAIAEASGGRFLTASNAAELRDALRASVGTSFEVLRAKRVVARGTLGADDRIRLPAGDYVVRFESAPPHRVSLKLASEETTLLVLERERGRVAARTQRAGIEYAACPAPDPGPAAPR